MYCLVPKENNRMQKIQTHSCTHSIVVALAACLWLMLSCAVVSAADIEEAKVVLSGKVVELTTGKPVPGMLLHLWVTAPGKKGECTTEHVTADEQGHFSTKVTSGSKVSSMWGTFAGGKYMVDERWFSDHRGPLVGVLVAQDMESLVFKVKLCPIVPLQGKVLDANGQPVENVKVYVHQAIPPATTDKAGNFTLCAVPTDQDFDLFAISEQKDLAGVAHFKAGCQTAQITLSPTQTYAGEARTTDDFPAQKLKFQVELMLNGCEFSREEMDATNTGGFTLAHVCPQMKYQFSWDSSADYIKGYPRGNAVYDMGMEVVDVSKIPAGQPIRLKVKALAYSVLGRVVNEQGQPIAGARVYKQNGQEVSRWDRDPRRYQLTDKDGRFTVDSLAAGDVAFRIVAPGYQGKTFTTKTDNVDFTAVLTSSHAEGAKIEAMVQDEQGNPVSQAEVRLTHVIIERYQQNAVSQNVATDAYGKAEFALQKDAPGDKNYLSCRAPGYVLPVREIAANEDASLVIKLKKEGRPRLGRLLGSDGKPISNARVRVEEWANAGLDPYVSCDAEGRFTLKGFAESDSVDVKMVVDGYVDSERLFFPRYNGLDRELKFFVERHGIIRGTVHMPDGSLAPGEWRIGARRLWQSIWDDTDVTSGSFELHGAEAGTWSLQVYSSLTPETASWICAAPVKVKMEENKVVETSITLTQGIPVSGRLVLPLNTQKEKSYILIADSATGEERDDYYKVYPFTLPISGEDAGKPWTLYLPEGEFEFRCGENTPPGSGMKITVTKDKPLKDVMIEVKAEK
ncbi:TPA: hypothetical protein DDW35_06490 [Candidatus Sumerlaeota bacterium]|jgi:uncharacterized GH25 family protein|nr:hypothetical protein [Candidatus Sumerlaeota bacterium]